MKMNVIIKLLMMAVVSVVISATSSAQVARPRFVYTGPIEEVGPRVKHSLKILSFDGGQSIPKVIWEPTTQKWLSKVCVFRDQGVLLVGLSDMQYGAANELLVKDVRNDKAEWEVSTSRIAVNVFTGGIVASDKSRQLLLPSVYSPAKTAQALLLQLADGERVSTKAEIDIRELKIAGVQDGGFLEFHNTLRFSRLKNALHPSGAFLATFAGIPDSMLSSLDTRWRMTASEEDFAVFRGLDFNATDTTMDILVYHYDEEQWYKLELPGIFTSLKLFGGRMAGTLRIAPEDFNFERRTGSQPKLGTSIIILDPATLAVNVVEINGIGQPLWAEPGRLIYRCGHRVFDATLDGDAITSRTMIVDHEYANGIDGLYWEIEDDSDR